MSTEIIKQVFPETLKILSDLIAFKTVSGENNNSLIDYCDDKLKALGAESFRTFDREKNRVNLFATLKSKTPNNKKGIILFPFDVPFFPDLSKTNKSVSPSKFKSISEN